MPAKSSATTTCSAAAAESSTPDKACVGVGKRCVVYTASAACMTQVCRYNQKRCESVRAGTDLHHLLGLWVHGIQGGGLGGEGLQVAVRILVEASTIGRGAGHHGGPAEVIEATIGLGVHGAGQRGEGALLGHEGLPCLPVAVRLHACTPCHPTHTNSLQCVGRWLRQLLSQSNCSCTEDAVWEDSSIIALRHAHARHCQMQQQCLMTKVVETGMCVKEAITSGGHGTTALSNLICLTYH